MNKEYKNERYNCACVLHCFTNYATSQLTENKYFTGYLRVGHVLLICKHNPKLDVEVYLNNQRFYLFHASTNFYEWNSLSIIKKSFKQIRLYTLLIQGVNTIFIDRIPTYLFLSTLYAGIKQLISLPHSLKILKNEKAKFKAAQENI